MEEEEDDGEEEEEGDRGTGGHYPQFKVLVLTL